MGFQDKNEKFLFNTDKKKPFHFLITLKTVMDVCMFLATSVMCVRFCVPLYLIKYLFW